MTALDGRRARPGEEAGRPRPALDPRPGRVPAAALRGGRAGAADRRSLRRGRGRHHGRGAQHVGAPPRPRLSIVRARVADGSGEIDAGLVQPGLARRAAQAGDARPAARRAGRPRPAEFSVRSYDIGGEAQTADFAPVYSASEELTVKKLRELVGRRSLTQATRGTRSPPASRRRTGCPGGPTPSGRCTGPMRPPRRSRAAGGSRSTSCSCSSSGSCGAAATARSRRRAGAAARPASSSRATASRCRSR